MANFDGTVKIDTKIDHGGFLKGFQKMSAQSQKLKNSISETTQQIDKLQKELNELQNAPLESTAMTRAQKNIDATTQKIVDLKTELNKAESAPVDHTQTDKIQKNIDLISKKINELNSKISEMQNVPLESPQITATSDSWMEAEEKYDNLIARRKQYETEFAQGFGGVGSAMIPDQASLDSLMQNDAEWKKISADIEKAELEASKFYQKLENAQSVAQSKKDSGISKVKDDIAQATQKLDVYKQSLQQAKEVANSKKLSGLMEIRGDIDKAVKSLKVYKKVYAEAKEVAQKKRDTAIDKQVTSIEKATNKLDVYKTKIAEVQEKESGIGKKIDSISNLAKKGFANMTKSGNKSNGMLDKLNGSVSRFTKRIWGVLSSALVFTVLSKAFTALREKIAATTKQNAQFSASMAVIRGNASSAFNTLITAAMPALNSLMSVIAKATTYLNTFISLLFGRTVKSANAAASATNGQAAALDKAGKAAKKASEYLNAYDEMNVQASDNDSSGGGGGGGSDLTYTEDADVEGQVAKYLDRIKKAWEKADFTEFGTMLGNKINGVLENIDWSGIQTGATKLGKSLATFLNGFFETPGLFSNVGKTIAESLNTAIDASLGFAENFHFDSAGQAIADTVNGFFKTFDFAKLAESINSWVDGLKTMISTAIKGISWSTILKDGLDFLTHLDLDTVVISIAAFKWFFGGKELVADALKSLMATKVQTGIGSSAIPVSAAIDLAITTAIIGFKVGNWIYENTSFSKFADAVAKWMVDENGDISVGKAITVTLTGLAISVSTAAIAGKVASAVGTALAGGVSLTGVELAITNIALKIATGANFVWSGMTVMAESLAGALGTTLSGLASVGNTIYVAIGKACMSATSAVASLSSTIASGISSAVASAGTFLSTNALTVFAGGAASIAAGLFAAIGAAIAGWKIGQLIYDKFSEQIDDIVFKVGDFFTKTIPQALNNAGKAVVDFTLNVKTSVEDIKQKAAEKWNEAKNWFDDKKYQIAVKIDDIKSKASDLWSNAKDWAKDKALSLGVKFSKSAKDLYNDIKEAWGKVSGKTFSIRVKLNNTAKGLFNSFKTAWGKIKTKLKFPMQMPHISWGTTQKTILGKKISVPSLSVKWYANGGFPDMGQLFIARERGAEMVGNIGGKTAVANNDQITTAIAAAVGPAVYDAMMSAMANGDSGQINLNLELGGQKITDYVIQDVKNRTFASGGRNPILV